MREHRTWEQMKQDNTGAPWIVDGEFCADFKRTSQSDDVNTLLDLERKEGLLEWQITGFNGCWSCDRTSDRNCKRLLQALK